MNFLEAIETKKGIKRKDWSSNISIKEFGGIYFVYDYQDQVGVISLTVRDMQNEDWEVAWS